MTVIIKEDVANMALDLLTEGYIDSLDEDTPIARKLTRWFDVVREGELTKNLWCFAMMFPDPINYTTASGTGEFTYLYEVPEDFLRWAWLTENGKPEGIPIQATHWADGIRTDFSGPLIMPYIGNVTEPSDMDALFTKAWAAALALPLAHGTTGKESMTNKIMGFYTEWIEEAQRKNAIMRLSKYPDRSWSVQRGDHRYWRP